MDIIPGNGCKDRHGHAKNVDASVGVTTTTNGVDDDGDGDGENQLLGTTPPPREAFKKRNSMTRMESYLSNSSGGGDEGSLRARRDRLDSDDGGDGDVNIFLAADELLDNLADDHRHDVMRDYHDDDDEDDEDAPFHMDDEDDGRRRRARPQRRKDDVPATGAIPTHEGEGSRRKEVSTAGSPGGKVGEEDGDHHHDHHYDYEDDAGPFSRHDEGIGDEDDEDDYDVFPAVASREEDEEVDEAIIRAEYPALRQRFFGGSNTVTADDVDDETTDPPPPCGSCLVETCFAALVLLALRCSAPSSPAARRGCDGRDGHRIVRRRVDMEAVHLLLSEIVSRYYRRYQHLGDDKKDGHGHGHEHESEKHGKKEGGSMVIVLEVEGVIRTLQDRVALIDIVASSSTAGAQEGERSCYEITLHPPDVVMGSEDNSTVPVDMDRFAAWLLVGHGRADDEVEVDDPSEGSPAGGVLVRDPQRTDTNGDTKHEESSSTGGSENGERGGVTHHEVIPPPSARRFWSYLVSSSSFFGGVSRGGGNDNTSPTEEVKEASRAIHAILAMECLRVLEDGKANDVVDVDVDVDVGGELSSALRRHLLDRVGLDTESGAKNPSITADDDVTSEAAESSSLRRYALLNTIGHVVGAGDLLTTKPGEILDRTVGSDAFLLRRLLLLPSPRWPDETSESSSPPPPQHPAPPRDMSVDASSSSASLVTTGARGDDDLERRVLRNWRSVIADAELWCMWADNDRSNDVTTRMGSRIREDPCVRLMDVYRGWMERCYGVRLSRKQAETTVVADGGDVARNGSVCSCYSSRHVGAVLLLLGRSLGRVRGRGGGGGGGVSGVAEEELLYHRESLEFQTRSVLLSSSSSSAMTRGGGGGEGRPTATGATAADEGFDVTRIASARVVDHRRWRRQKREAAAAKAALANGNPTAATAVVGRSVIVSPLDVDGGIENDVEEAWGERDGPSPTPTATIIDVVDSRGRRLRLPVPRGSGGTTGDGGGGGVASPPTSATLDLAVLGETLHEIGCAILSSAADGDDNRDTGEKTRPDDEDDEDRHEVAVRYLNGARQLLRLFIIEDDDLRSESDRSLTGVGSTDELDRKHHGDAVALSGGGSVASSSSCDVSESPPIGSMLDPDEYRRVCTVLASVEVHLGTVRYTHDRKFHEALAHFDRALGCYRRVGIGKDPSSSSSSPGTLNSPRSTVNFREQVSPSPSSSSLIGQMLASLRDGDGTRQYKRADLLRRIKLHVAQRSREYRKGDDADDGEDVEADADAWDELSSLYGWMGSTHREMGHHQTALECFVESVVCANASAASTALAPSTGGGDGHGRLSPPLAVRDYEGGEAGEEIIRNHHGGAMARGFFNMAVTLDDMGMYDQSVRFYHEAWSYYWSLWLLRSYGSRTTPSSSFRRRRRARRVGDDCRLFADMMECVLCMGNVMTVRSDRSAAMGYYLEGLVLFLAEWCNLSLSAIVAPTGQPRLRHLRTRGHDVFGDGTSEKREVDLMVDVDGGRLHCVTRFLVSDDFNVWNVSEDVCDASRMSTDDDRSAVMSTNDYVANNGSNVFDEDERRGNDSIHMVPDHKEEDCGGYSLDASIVDTTAEESDANIIEAESHLHACLRERLQRLFAAVRDIHGKRLLDPKSRPSKNRPAHSSAFSRADFCRIMSDVAFYLNDTESAVEYCQRSFDVAGDDNSSLMSSWSLYRLGVHNIRLQDYAAAKSKLALILECHPGKDGDHHANLRRRSDALYHLGYCHAQLGNRKESHRCYELSLRLLSTHHQHTHATKPDEREKSDYDLSCANIWHEMACLRLSCNGSESSVLTKTSSSDPHFSTTDEALRYFIRSVEIYQLHGHVGKQPLTLAFSLKHLAVMYRLILQCDDVEAGENENRASLMKNETHDLLCEAMIIWQKVRATEKLNHTTVNSDANVSTENDKVRDESGVVLRCPSPTELEMADIFYEFGLLSLASPSLQVTDKNDLDKNSNGANEEDERKEAEQNFKRALYAYLHYYQYYLAASSSARNESRGRRSHVGSQTSIRNSVKLAKVYQNLSRTTRGNVKSGYDEACGSRSLLYLQNAKNIMTNVNSSASDATASSSSTVQSSSTAAALESGDEEDFDMDEPQRRRLEFEAELCHDLGTEYVFLQKHSSALDCLSRSLELRRMIGKSLSILEEGHLVCGNGDDEMPARNTEQRLAAELGLRHDDIVSNAVKMARTCNNIGIIHAKVGRYDVAMSYLQEALLFTTRLPEEASGDLDRTELVVLSTSCSDGLSSAIPTTEAKEERSNTLFSMGHVHAKKLNFEEALKCFEASLSILRAIEAEKKDAHGFILSNLLHSLGRTHAKLHQWTEAKLCYQESVEIRRLGMRDQNKLAIDVSSPLHETPNSAHENDISEEEDDHWVMTDDEDDDIDGPLRLSHSLHHLGIAHEHLGDYQNAMICYEEAWFLRKLHLTRDHVIMAQSLLRMGNVKVQDGCHYEVALKLYQEALRVQTLNLGEDHLSVAETYYRMGMIRHVRGEWTQARECYKKALGIYGSNGESRCHSNYDEDMTGTTMADIMNAWKEVKVYEKECIDSEGGGLVHDWSKLSVDPKGCSEKMEEMLLGLLGLVDQYIVTPGCEMAQQNISKAVSSIQEYYSWTTCPTATSLPMVDEGTRTTPSDSRVHGVAQQIIQD